MAHMAYQWCGLAKSLPVSPSLGEWDEVFKALEAETENLKRRGQWAEGPHDLLSIVGLNRWELAHSAALAWLCNPYAGHGLGDRFLRSLIACTGDPVALEGLVVCATEVSRARSRADVVVQGKDWTLIIEVKVDAIEGTDQAQRLFDDWVDDDDVRFIFLTRHGLGPRTADSETASRWAPLAWRSVLGMLAALTPDEKAPAQVASSEYLRTLKATFG